MDKFPEEYKKLYEATRKRAQQPKKKAGKRNNCTTLSCSPGLRPDEAWRLEFRDVTVVDDEDLARRSWRLKCAESATSDIARVCPVP